MLNQLPALFLGLTCFLGLETMNADLLAQENPTETIVFLGDSITQSGDQPGGYVDLVRKELAADTDSIQVIGAGISGNKVPDLQARLQNDVLDRKPTTVVIYIGINDVWHSQSGNGTPLDEYETGLKDIVSKIQESGARVILATPSVIGEKTDGSNELDTMLDEYSQTSRQVAASCGVELLDLRARFIKFLKRENPENKSKGILTNDGVHLNSAGNRFVAQQMLAALRKASSDRVLRHIVMFKFTDGLEQARIDEVVTEFAKLQHKIDSIVDFEQGTNNSPEGLSQGFTHCFTVTFKDTDGRNEYLPHPAHKEFVELLQGRVDKVLVFDYWSN